ncbi:MAG: hypothetical protein ABSH12_08840 [Endomicrobiales bacterium]|jgi:hypothetical protein
MTDTISRNRPDDLSVISDDELLKLRFCDLGITIKGTWLEECVNTLYGELISHGLHFKPRCYLADEWLTPDNEPVVGIAFYLAHCRLRELEQRFMHEIEGGDTQSCMKLLRHETGHAINYAYRFHTRKRWKQLFGRFSDEYPDRYKYRPYSRSFVLHLDDWYAQYHPDEDFAETFAVWLSPEVDWRQRYQGWKALDKLVYVDTLMKEIASKAPLKKSGHMHWNITTLKTTLKTHYKRKTEFYAEYSPDFHDAHLTRIFPSTGSGGHGKAAGVLTKYKKDIVTHVAYWTGERKYIINRLLKNLIKRCRELALVSGTQDAYPVMKVTAYITSLIMNYVYTGRFRRKK